MIKGQKESMAKALLALEELDDELEAALPNLERASLSNLMNQFTSQKKDFNAMQERIAQLENLGPIEDEIEI